MIKRPSSETACPLSQGSRDSDECGFFSEREKSRFLIKALLIRKSTGPSVSKAEASDLTGAC